MGRPQRCIDIPAAIGDQTDQQIMHAEIDRDLLVTAPGDEGGDGVDIGHIAVHRHTGGHADDVGFSHPLHVMTVGEARLHVVQQARAEVGADKHHPIIARPIRGSC